MIEEETIFEEQTEEESTVEEVALRKESVDRNNTMQVVIVIVNAVALRKESVDRNRQCWRIASTASGRSPQGERG